MSDDMSSALERARDLRVSINFTLGDGSRHDRGRRRFRAALAAANAELADPAWHFIVDGRTHALRIVADERDVGGGATVLAIGDDRGEAIEPYAVEDAEQAMPGPANTAQDALSACSVRRFSRPFAVHADDLTPSEVEPVAEQMARAAEAQVAAEVHQAFDAAVVPRPLGDYKPWSYTRDPFRFGGELGKAVRDGRVEFVGSIQREVVQTASDPARFAIFETVSCEGSPVTPEFGSVDEAIDYAAEHCTVMRRSFSRDEWVRRLDYPDGMKPLT